MSNTSRLSQILESYESKKGSSTKVESPLIFGDNKEYKLEIANDFETRIEAYRLLYRTYVQKEFTAQHHSKMWYSIFDAHPDTTTFVVKHHGKVCGALTVVVDSPMGLPADSLFQEEVDRLRAKKEVLAEIISLGIESNPKDSSIIIGKLFNLSSLYAIEVFKVTRYAITVNPRHSSFYKRKLLFESVGEVKSYNRVGDAPAQLLTLDLQFICSMIETSRNLLPKYKRTAYSNFISLSSFKKSILKIQKDIRKMNPDEIKYFFLQKRKLFADTSASTMHLLQSYYPEIDFAQLLSPDESGFLNILS